MEVVRDVSGLEVVPETRGLYTAYGREEKEASQSQLYAGEESHIRVVSKEIDEAKALPKPKRGRKVPLWALILVAFLAVIVVIAVVVPVVLKTKTYVTPILDYERNSNRYLVSLAVPHHQLPLPSPARFLPPPQPQQPQQLQASNKLLRRGLSMAQASPSSAQETRKFTTCGYSTNISPARFVDHSLHPQPGKAEQKTIL